MSGKLDAIVILLEFILDVDILPDEDFHNKSYTKKKTLIKHKSGIKISERRHKKITKKRR
jgi:hypothetical protein